MSQGMIYNIQRMSVQDGPGLRTTVFLKGCPLRCLWCSNPESQQFTPQMLLFDNLCVSCGACMQVCPNGAVVPLENGKMGRDTEKCTHCGACTEVCPNKARVMSGRIMTVEEVMEVVRKDWLFYENSGGGVTFGGGEPLMHADFLRAFIWLVNGRWKVRAETSLHVPPENAVLPLDEYIVDIKDMNPAIYHAYTGGNAALARENLAAVLRAGSADRVLARVPLIPDYNTEGDVQKSVEALRAMGVTRVDPFRFLRKEA